MSACDEPIYARDLFSYVYPHVQGTPDAVMEHFIMDAYVTFATRSGVLCRDVTIDIQEGVEDYLIELEDCDLEPVALSKVCIDCNEYTPSSKGEYACRSLECGPRRFEMRDPYCIAIYPIPQCDAHADITLSVAPSRDCLTLDPYAYQEFARTIADGAASNLLMSSNQDMKDLRLATHLERRFYAGIARARARKWKQFSCHSNEMRACRWV